MSLTNKMNIYCDGAVPAVSEGKQEERVCGGERMLQ